MYCSDWVKDTWAQDFTHCEDLPVEIEEELQETGFHHKELRELAKLLQPWISPDEDQGIGKTFWDRLHIA